MKYLLDTNVVSEWTKPRPDPGVIRWLHEVDEDRVFLSVITVAEIRYGIERLVHGQRRTRLNEWLERELRDRFEGRILVVDGAIADTCGRLLAISEASGRRMEVVDGIVAATARVCGLSIVTRNASDFGTVAIDVVNPWLRGDGLEGRTMLA